MSDHPSTATPAIWFPGWAEVLQRQARFSPFQPQPYRRAIIDYLRLCKRSRLRATVVARPARGPDAKPSGD